jgi:hypothetical protein
MGKPREEPDDQPYSIWPSHTWQTVVGVVLVVVLTFGAKYLLFDSAPGVSSAKAPNERVVPTVNNDAYTITTASWATQENLADDGVVAPEGGAEIELPEAVIDPEREKMMREAAKKWQVIDIAVRDN